MSILGTRSRCNELIARLDEEVRRIGTDDGIAAEIGRNRGTLSNWRKQGHIKLVPDLTNLEWLGVDVGYVITGQRTTSCSTSSKSSNRNAGELLDLFQALPEEEQVLLLQGLRDRRADELSSANSVGSPEMLIQSLQQLPPELGRVIGQLVQVAGSLTESGREGCVAPGDEGRRRVSVPQGLEYREEDVLSSLRDNVNGSRRTPIKKQSVSEK